MVHDPSGFLIKSLLEIYRKRSWSSRWQAASHFSSNSLLKSNWKYFLEAVLEAPGQIALRILVQALLGSDGKCIGVAWANSSFLTKCLSYIHGTELFELISFHLLSNSSLLRSMGWVLGVSRATSCKFTLFNLYRKSMEMLLELPRQPPLQFWIKSQLKVTGKSSWLLGYISLRFPIKSLLEGFGKWPLSCIGKCPYTSFLGL